MPNCLNNLFLKLVNMLLVFKSETYHILGRGLCFLLYLFTQSGKKCHKWLKCHLYIVYAQISVTYIPRRKCTFSSKFYLMGTMPGHNEACFFQMLSLQDPSWLRGACPPRAKVLKQISWVSEQNRKILPEGRQRPRRNALYK